MSIYKFMVGVVLALAMIIVLALSFLTFSARDFQFGVQQISPTTDGLISFQRLAEADRQIQQLQQGSAGPRGEQLQIQQRVTALDTQAQAAQASVNDARAGIVGSIADIEARASVQPAQSAAADVSAQALSQRINTLAGRPGLSPGDQRSVTTLRAEVQHMSEQEASHDDTNAERTALQSRQRLVDGQVAESDRQIFALQQQVLPDYQQYARVRNEAYALQSMSPLGISAFLAQGSPSLLSPLLVVLMGALGSLLYLFPAYLNRPQPVTMAEIAVRLIFGMCAALALYVLLNATIAGISITQNNAQASTSSLLNPFTVSLIGIIAGVLSEDIAKWIQDRGRGIFTQGGAPAAPAQPAADDTGSMINPHGGPNAP
jgi:hypothetical protein